MAPAAANIPVEVLRYFLRIKEGARFGAADAKALGRLVVRDLDGVRGKRDRRPLEIRLRVVVERTAVLREIVGRFPFFEGLLLEVLRNRVRFVKENKKELSSFGEQDGRQAGKMLASSLLVCVSSDAAVAAWFGLNPALGELEQLYGWLKPLLNSIGAEILAQVAWGVKFRAYLGAAMSFGDIVSDSVVVVAMYEARGASEASADASSTRSERRRERHPRGASEASAEASTTSHDARASAEASSTRHEARASTTRRERAHRRAPLRPTSLTLPLLASLAGTRRGTKTPQTAWWR
jgi:hypothetical protein